MTSTLKKSRGCEVRLYLSHEEKKKMESEAKERGNISVSAAVRQCFAEYKALRKEMATAIGFDAADNSTSEQKIIHSILARTEERIISTIERQDNKIEQLLAENKVLMAMVDKMFLSLMVHLPEVAEDNKEAIKASARRRHQQWYTQVEKSI